MIKIILNNKNAYYKYSIIHKIEAGIALLGWEIKSIRKKKININNSFILIKNNEAYLHNTVINPLITKSKFTQHDSIRTRKLLLKKHELNNLLKHINNKKHTIIPLELYWKQNWIKIRIAIGKGQTKYDKRIKIKKREWILDKNRISI